MSIAIRKPPEIEALRAANRIVGKTINHLKSQIKPGITLKELDQMGEEMILSCGATPSFKGLYGFPGSICISVNEVIIHGIPNDYKLQEGDIVGLDIGTQLNGWYGDAAITCGVGNISQSDERLIACSRDALYFAISQIKVGMHFKELSALIEQFILDYGYVPLHGFCGHGIGRKPHEEPEIPNYLEGKKLSKVIKSKKEWFFVLSR